VNNRHVLPIRGAALALFVSLCGSLVWAQAPAGKATPLIVGQWKLNPEKSNLHLPPDYLEIRQYNLRPDGFLIGLLITVNARGIIICSSRRRVTERIIRSTQTSLWRT
jgi:hypothetical protein